MVEKQGSGSCTEHCRASRMAKTLRLYVCRCRIWREPWYMWRLLWGQKACS